MNSKTSSTTEKKPISIYVEDLQIIMLILTYNLIYNLTLFYLQKVDKDSIRGQIEAKYVHEPYISVYNTVIEQAKEKLAV